tara:strand:- start:3980 stop:4480 length:501 start_codon:yes stop_codon:yes gene_type:complete
MVVIKEQKVKEVNIIYKNSAGYCTQNICVTQKMYENKKEFYYMDYKWYFTFYSGIVPNCISSSLTWNELKRLENKISASIPLKQHDNFYKVFMNEIDSLKQTNPFYDDNEFLNDSFNGEIISKNEMTEQLVRILCMDDELLSKKCGNVTSQIYRKSIMYNISNLRH